MNEVLFLGFALFLLTLNLFALRMGRVYLFILIALYTLLMNIFVLKQFNLFGLMITGGNALYGATFLITDILAEFYGKKEAHKAVWIGFGTTLLFVVATQVLLAFTPNSEDFAQESLQTLFSLSPRILLGSLLAFIISQHLDIYLFDRIKKATHGKFLWLRNNGSTLISQFVDTVIFHAVGLTAFAWLPLAGIISVEYFWPIVLATYLIKVLMALLDTPFLYAAKKVKKD